MATVKKRNWPTYVDGQLNTPAEARERAEIYNNSADKHMEDSALPEGQRQDYVDNQRRRATQMYDVAREMEQLGHLQPPADVAGLEENLRAQRPDLDIYWSPSPAEGEGGEVVHWTLNADNPDGSEYAAIDFEVYDRHEAIDLAAENPAEAERRRHPSGWSNSHTHTAAAILQNTQVEASDGEVEAADLAAVELELVGGDDAESIMRQTVEANAEGWADFDPSQVDYQEIKDLTAADMPGIELDDEWESRLASYKEPHHGVAGQIKEITVRRGEYMEASEHGQTIDAYAHTEPVEGHVNHERMVKNEMGGKFVDEALKVPSKEHPQGKPGGIDPYAQAAMSQQQAQASADVAGLS